MSPVQPSPGSFTNPSTPANKPGSSTAPSAPSASFSSTVKQNDLATNIFQFAIGAFGLYCAFFKLQKWYLFYKTICKQAEMAGPKPHLKTQLYFYQEGKKINPLRNLLTLNRYTKIGNGCQHACHVLHGHPGTGKTVCAKDLIYQESKVRPAFYFGFKYWGKSTDQTQLKAIADFLFFMPNVKRELKLFYRRLWLLPSFCLFTPVVYQLVCESSNPFIYPAIAVSIAVSAGLRFYLWTKVQPLHRMVRDQYTPLVILDDVNIPIKANQLQYLGGQFFDLADVKYFSSEKRVAVDYFQSQTCFKHVVRFIKFSHSKYRDKFTIQQVNQMLKNFRGPYYLKNTINKDKEGQEIKELNEVMADSNYFVRDVLSVLIILAEKSQKIKQAATIEKFKQATCISEPVFALRQELIKQYKKQLTNFMIPDKKLCQKYRDIEYQRLKLTVLLQLLVQLFEKEQGGPIRFYNNFSNQPGVLCSVLVQLNVIMATHDWLAPVNKLAFQGMKRALAEMSEDIKKQRLDTKLQQMLNEFKRKCSRNFDIDSKPEGQ